MPGVILRRKSLVFLIVLVVCSHGSCLAGRGVLVGCSWSRRCVRNLDESQRAQHFGLLIGVPDAWHQALRFEVFVQIGVGLLCGVHSLLCCRRCFAVVGPRA